MADGMRIVVPLKTPIMHGDDVITELELTEPDLGGMMKLDEANGTMSEALATICACTNLPPSVIKQIRLRDLNVVQNAVLSMLGEESRETGVRRRPGSLTSITGRRVS